MTFNHSAPDWNAVGTEPAEELKQLGWQPNQKPPASIFNWFWTKTSKCIAEIQNMIKIETGTSETGVHYRKYADGYVEMWGHDEYPTDVGTNIVLPFCIKNWNLSCIGSSIYFVLDSEDFEHGNFTYAWYGSGTAPVFYYKVCGYIIEDI